VGERAQPGGRRRRLGPCPSRRRAGLVHDGEDARAVIDGGGDFEDLRSGIVLSTYSYSPAAMFDPRVFGFGIGPQFFNPNTSAGLQGFGYRSPTVSQCVHPSLKTRIMEMHAIELAPDDCNPSNTQECVPYQWNQSYRSRPLTAFFDGSVRITTPREFMFAESRESVVPRLWLRGTPYVNTSVNCRPRFAAASFAAIAFSASASTLLSAIVFSISSAFASRIT
jgi:hypothetical protein